VAIDSAPVKGILTLPFSTLRVGSAALRNPANDHRAQPITAAQFRYAFGNTLTEEQSQAAYERYAVPGPDHVLFQASFAKASVTEANFKRYRKSRAVTDFKEFPERSHFTIGEAGWEEVADYALDWAVTHALQPAA
jgi:hypothetical protein